MSNAFSAVFSKGQGTTAPAATPTAKPKENSFSGVFGGRVGTPTFVPTAIPPEPPPKPNIAQKVNTYVNETLGDPVGDAFKTLKTSAEDFSSSITEGKDTTAQKIGKGVDVGVNVAQAALSPITGVFSVADKVAKQIPVIKQLTEGVDYAFNLVGQAGAGLAKGTVLIMPISDKAKQDLSPYAEKLGSFGSQIIIGSKLLPINLDKVMNADISLKGVKTETIPAAKTAPAPTPQAKGSFVEVPPETIAAPNTFSSAIETKKVAPEPIQQPAAVVPMKEGPTIPVAKDAEGMAAATPTIPEVKPIDGTGETKVRGLSKGVEANAIEHKLTEGFGDLPEYNTINIKEQAQKASDMLAQDAQRAKRIAMGQEAPPSDILPESVFVAVEDRAVKQGDVATLRDLATSSHLTSEATTMGQRIRALAERDPESPISAIKDVARIREDNATKRLAKGEDVKKARRTVADQIKSEIRRQAPTKQTWSEFISSIQC